MRTLVEWHSVHHLLMMPTMEIALDEIQNPDKNPNNKFPLAYAKDMSVVKPQRAITGYSRDMPAELFSRDLEPVLRQKRRDKNKIECEEETHRSA